MAVQLSQTSLFAASRDAAQRILENKPVLHFETTDMSRLRDYFTKQCEMTNERFDEIKAGYELINIARRRLGITE